MAIGTRRTGGFHGWTPASLTLVTARANKMLLADFVASNRTGETPALKLSKARNVTWRQPPSVEDRARKSV